MVFTKYQWTQKGDLCEGSLIRVCYYLRKQSANRSFYFIMYVLPISLCALRPTICVRFRHDLGTVQVRSIQELGADAVTLYISSIFNISTIHALFMHDLCTIYVISRHVICTIKSSNSHDLSIPDLRSRHVLGMI